MDQIPILTQEQLQHQYVGPVQANAGKAQQVAQLVTQLKEDRDALIAKVDQLRQKIAAKKEELGTANEQVGTLQGRVQELETSNGDKDQTILALTEENQALKLRVTQLESQLDQLTRTSRETIERLTQTNETQAKTIDEQVQEISKLKAALALYARGFQAVGISAKAESKTYDEVLALFADIQPGSLADELGDEESDVDA